MAAALNEDKKKGGPGLRRNPPNLDPS